MLQRYHSAHFFDPCPNSTPYYFFYRLAVLDLAQQGLAQQGKRSGSAVDVLEHVGFRRLEGSRLYARNYYLASKKRRPLFRTVRPNCDNLSDIPLVLDFELNVEEMTWEKVDLQKSSKMNLYQWFGGGFSDYGHYEKFKWRVSTDEFYERYQQEHKDQFLSSLEQKGISTTLPDLSKWECK